MNEITKWFKSKKWYWQVLIIILLPLIGALVALFYVAKSKNDSPVILDKDDLIRMDKNKSGTQVLPKSKKLDAVIVDILRSIDKS